MLLVKNTNNGGVFLSTPKEVVGGTPTTGRAPRLSGCHHLGRGESNGLALEMTEGRIRSGIPQLLLVKNTNNGGVINGMTVSFVAHGIGGVGAGGAE
jgi:hypothetical protein